MRPWNVCAAALLLALPTALGGCSDREHLQRDLQRQLGEANARADRASEALRQLEARREQDRRVLEARERESRADVDAAVTLVIATAAALTGALLLLAKEVVRRRALEARLAACGGGQPGRGKSGSVARPAVGIWRTVKEAYHAVSDAKPGRGDLHRQGDSDPRPGGGGRQGEDRRHGPALGGRRPPGAAAAEENPGPAAEPRQMNNGREPSRGQTCGGAKGRC